MTGHDTGQQLCAGSSQFVASFQVTYEAVPTGPNTPRPMGAPYP